MSEQIREQVSAFLDGELPDSETELLLKRLTRDGELRESFGRYALIGEAVRGSSSDIVTRGFSSRVNLAIDGEPVQVAVQAQRSRSAHWWRPIAGVGVAAGVAAVAIVAFQQRSISPTLTASPMTARNTVLQSTVSPHEALSYTVPASSPPSAMAPARLTNYVFAHSKYSSGLGQRGVLADLLIDDDEASPAARDGAVKPAHAAEVRVAP